MHAPSVRGAVDSLANSRGRSAQHLVIGLALTAGAVGLSALAARLSAQSDDEPEVYSDYEEAARASPRPTHPAFALIWPPLFLALTVSGLRIWNAPRSGARTQALTLWGLVQFLNTIWMALGPRRLGGQLAAAVASLGTALAYVWRARRVDAPAANLVAPYVGWAGVANVLTEEIWRKNRDRPTLH